MSNDPTSSSDTTAWFTPTIRTALLVWGVVLLGAYGLYALTDGQIADASTAAAQSAIPKTPLDLTLPASAEFATEPAIAEIPPTVPPQGPALQDIALAKGRWLEFERKVTSTRKRLDAAAEDVRQWSVLLKDLPGNEAGRRIAGSVSHVDQFLALHETSHPDAEHIDALREALDVQQETAQSYLGQAENTSVPSDALTVNLERQFDEAETLAIETRRARKALEALVAQTASLPVAEQTLGQAAETRSTEVANRYRTELASAKAAATEEAQQKLQQAEQEAIRLKAEAEAEQVARVGAETAKRLREETELHVQQMLADAEERKREAEAGRLQKLAEDPNVQKKYSAFLQKGYIQFSFPPGFIEHRSERPLPVSLNDLIGKGWLKDAESFARAISRKPNTEYRAYNDRPTLPYPTSDADWKEMERLLDEFKMLGPVWVKMELLRP